MGRPMRTSSVLSSWSTRALCESALGMAIMEYDSPVCEKQLSSTPVILIPRAIGKVDLCAARVILWSTTERRSPWFSAEPPRSMNLRCAAARTYTDGQRSVRLGVWGS